VTGVLFFLIFFGYFAIFEIAWNGQTPGKRMIGIRVVKDSGRPLTAAESIGRNLLRIVDQLPGFYAIGIVVAILNSSNKRLGDLVAGSVVVRESSLAAIKPVWQTMRTETGPLLGGKALSIEDLALIDAFLNRRSELLPDVRSRMAAQILNQLRPKLPFHADTGLSTESVLESLAWERRSAG
jgi:RDD family